MHTTIFYSCYILGVFANLYAYGNPDALASLNKIISKTPEADQAIAVQGLLKRIVPKHAEYFVIHVNQSYFNLPNNMDAFEFYSTRDGKISVYGTTGVAAAAGLNNYLKYWCGIHFSWSGDRVKFPNTLPRVDYHVRQTFNERFRYYQNVCTVSYSMAFWSWTRWEREIDWMALNGINFPLAFTGQESIWQIVYRQLGLTQAELDAHFAGPAFLAWQRMGNIDGWGGPLPPSWYKKKLFLQLQILSQMRSFGMIPILPGFAGHIPKALVQRLYPKAKYFKLNSWNYFPGTYLLDATDPLYLKIGKMFISAQQQIYHGTDHVYSVDVFNEMQPPLATTGYIHNVSSSIYSVMKAADPKAVWLLQGWFFLSGFWKPELMKAWLTAVPLGKLIVLDLASDMLPRYKVTNGYYGHPFLWCMIQNYGGATRLYGRIKDNMKDYYQARIEYQQNMIGVGLTAEGINQNYVDFEFMIEMAYHRTPINVNEWIQSYLERRYGKDILDASIISAWDILIHSVYNDHNRVWDERYNSRVPVMRPRVTNKLDTEIWYDPQLLFSAWQHMVAGSEKKVMIDTLRHDIVMLGTQVLEDISTSMYRQIIYAYNNKSASGVLYQGSLLTDLLSDMDLLLSANKYSLLGNWLESAKQLGDNDAEKRLLEYNARNQITLWGPNGEIHDYANKNWGGLVKSYYQTRWLLFAGQLYNSVAKGKKFDQSKFANMLLDFGKAWNKDRDLFPTTATGDVIEISKMLIMKYKHFYVN